MSPETVGTLAVLFVLAVGLSFVGYKLYKKKTEKYRNYDPPMVTDSNPKYVMDLPRPRDIIAQNYYALPNPNSYDTLYPPSMYSSRRDGGYTTRGWKYSPH